MHEYSLPGPDEPAPVDGIISSDTSPRRRMPGQRNVGKKYTTPRDSVTYRMPAPAGAPRSLAELTTGRCICKSLAPWARPCGAHR